MKAARILKALITQAEKTSIIACISVWLKGKTRIHCI